MKNKSNNKIEDFKKTMEGIDFTVKFITKLQEFLNGTTKQCPEISVKYTTFTGPEHDPVEHVLSTGFKDKVVIERMVEELKREMTISLKRVQLNYPDYFIEEEKIKGQA